MPLACHITRCVSFQWGKCDLSWNTLAIRRSSWWGIQMTTDCPIQMTTDCPILTSSDCPIQISSDCSILSSSAGVCAPMRSPPPVMHSYAHPPRKKVVPLHRKKDTTPNDIRSLTYCNTKFFCWNANCRELTANYREILFSLIYGQFTIIYVQLQTYWFFCEQQLS